METSLTVSAIGLMSGTSLDGLDIAFINFKFSHQKWDYEFVHTVTVPYPEELKIAFQKPFQWVGSQFALYDEKYCNFLASSIIEQLESVKEFQPLFIASHGQTLFHQPHLNYTFQLGSGSKIAAKTGIPCVSDFRNADIDRGGQGAPLVPIGDELLFYAFDNCVNIGGFANCSFKIDQQRIAYDISPANYVLNNFARQMGKEFDSEGSIASAGKVIPELFSQLNALEYFQKKPPKSLGAEFVDKTISPILENYSHCQLPDLMCTFTEHIAYQIATNLKPGNCLLTGGGARNSYLIERIKSRASQTEIVVPSEELIDFKEALIFGLMGVLRWYNLENILSSVTGAKDNHCAGSIHL